MLYENQVGIVTGGGTGIGAETAKRFARAGARVAIVGRRKHELHAVASEIENSGGTCLVIEGDVSLEADVDAAIEAVLRKWGRLDFAFNNAGVIGAMKPIVDLTTQNFDEAFSINTKGVWLCLRAEIRAMLKLSRGGSIVNTSSFVARAPNAGSSIYASTKAALDSMIQAVALEVGAQGIRVNNVAPGVVRTPMSADLPGDFQEALAKHAAVKRLGEPHDIADAVLWLCSPQASFVTGQSILVDGGFAIPGLR